MYSILSKLLNRRGIGSIENLSKEEKVTFENYNKILSKEELTIDDVKKFLVNQISVIEGKWRDLTLDQEKKSQLIPYHTVYKTILQAIDSPQIERQALETYLNQQLNI